MLVKNDLGIITQEQYDTGISFSPNEIRRSYLKGWFLIDLVSSIPWDVLISAFIHKESNFKFLRFLKILTLIKLLRITRLAKAARRWEEVSHKLFTVITRTIKICIW